LKDDLRFHLARHSNKPAAEISASLVAMGYKPWQQTDSNQAFFILAPALVQAL
jgi:threonine aldolase